MRISNLILIFLFLLFAFSHNAYSQGNYVLVIAAKVLPSNPTISDSIRIVAGVVTPELNKKYYSIAYKSRDTVYVVFCVGSFDPRQLPKAYVDTFNLGTFSQGIYTLKITGYGSPDSCANIVYTTDSIKNFTVATSNSIPVAIVGTSYQLNVFPTPAKRFQTLSFLSTKTELLSINLTDLSGRVVLKVINEEVEAGERSIPVDVSSLAPGLYFYRIRIGEREQVLKMVKE